MIADRFMFDRPGHSLRGLCGLKLVSYPDTLSLVNVTACEGCVD